jgi:hypothetical protein
MQRRRRWRRAGMVRRPRTIGRACVAFGLAAGLLASAALADNVLPNGDFEAATAKGLAEGWSSTTWGRLGPAECGVSKRAAHSGKTGLWMASQLGPVDFATYSPPLDLANMGSAFVSFYYQTRESPRFSVAFASFGPEFASRQWDAPVIQYETRPLPPTKTWQLAAWHITPCPKASVFLLLFHMADSGFVFVDDARLTRWPDRLTCQAVLPGVVSRLPATRLVRARLSNRTDEDIAGRGLLTVTATVGRPIERQAPFTVRAHTDELFEVDYNMPADRPHRLQLAFAAPDRREVYDALELSPSPFLSLEIVRPAFRQTVLSTIPFDGLVARLHACATDEVASGMTPTAYLASDVGGAPESPCEVAHGVSPTTWEIRGDQKQLAEGHYTLHTSVEMAQGKPLALATDLWVRPRHRWEIGYDSAGRLLVSGTPMLPLGILDVHKADDLAALRDAHFTFVVVSENAADDALLRQAHAMGLKVAVSATYADAPRWAAIQARIGDQAAVLGWFAPPEPDRLQLRYDSQTSHLMAPSALRAALAQADPYHPVLTMLGLPEGPLTYADAGDILLIGAAPVPYWGLDTLADRLDVALKAGTGKPVWAVIQTHAQAGSGATSADTRTVGRPPSPAEQRCLTYLALASGARGIVYSSYRAAPTGRMRQYFLPEDAPELWESVGRTNEELMVLAPYFLDPQGPEPLDTGAGPLHAAAFRHGKTALVLVVNPALQEASAEIRLPFRPAGPMRELFGGDAEVAVSGDILGGFFPPLAVAVCEVPVG